jgi:hypothetical protein
VKTEDGAQFEMVQHDMDTHELQRAIDASIKLIELIWQH